MQSVHSVLETLARRPARQLLATCVAAALAARSSTAKQDRKRAAELADTIPMLVTAALREEAVELRFDLEIKLERARRLATRLAGLDAALGAGGDSVAIVVPALGGAPARFLTAKPNEIADAASAWRAFEKALATDPNASASEHLTFPPRGSSRDCEDFRAPSDEAAAFKAAADLSRADS